MRPSGVDAVVTVTVQEYQIGLVGGNRGRVPLNPRPLGLVMIEE